ncbi:MAG: hypothetical protein HY762_07855 [Planctomycetes bacterium]|nr:hypothetical protein [Planctomycetota bacterium]
MDKNLLCHIKIFLPAYNELPLKKAQEWAERYYSEARHTSGHRRKAIRTQKDFQEKIAKPIIQTTQGFINPEFISRSGLTAEDIANKMKSKLLDGRTADKYLKGLDRAFRKVDGITAKKVRDKLPLGAADYALKMTFGAWRMLGPLNEAGKSPIMLAENYLTGEQDIINFLRDKDRLFDGKPILITEPENCGKFKKEFHNCLMRNFKNICDLNYAPDNMERENNVINQLINNFVSDRFARFSSGGESHLDFVLEPESVIPNDAPVINDIKYKIYAFFLGEKMADHLRSKWIETQRVAPVNPADYIGNLDKSAYFDMYLDIQVARK